MDSVVGKLHVGDRRFALHRQGDFLVSQPFEHIQQCQGISQHRQRKIMAAQTKGRNADQQSGDGADDARAGDADPWREPPMELRQRDEIGTQTEECGMSEGYEAAIAAQDIPGQAHHRPDRHDGQDQLVIGMIGNGC